MAIKKDIRYLSKDFEQFRDNLIQFSKTYFPDMVTDWNESSPQVLFLEMSSYVGDVLSYYMDNQLRESLIDTVSYKPDLYNLASNFGYSIKNTIPAQCTLDIYQLVPATMNTSGDYIPDYKYALTIDAGMRVQSESTGQEFRTTSLVNFKVSGSNNPTNVYVHSVNDTTNNPEWFLLQKSVNAISGTQKMKQFHFNSAKRFDKILLEDTNIINIEKIIDSDNNTWTEVPYLAQNAIFETITNTLNNDPKLAQYNDSTPYLLKLKSVPRRFITKFRADNNVEIQFGSGIENDYDDEIILNPDTINILTNNISNTNTASKFMYTRTFGLAPSNIDLYVYYNIGGGIASNVPSNDITKIISTTFTIDETLFTDSELKLLNTCKQSVASNNSEAAYGGKNEETFEEIRQNVKASFFTQDRIVSKQDFITRAYSMPLQYGSIAKAYCLKDTQITTNNSIIDNPLAINLYTLGYDMNGNLTQLNPATKTNLKSYLSQYRLLTDAINIKDAYIINIGIDFDIITLPNANSNEVLLKCINKLKELFTIDKWQINQPIYLRNLSVELDKIDGVQTVNSIKIINLYDVQSGYSPNKYDIESATRNNIIYPSLDCSIFEIKYPNIDIQGKVISN